MKKSTIYSMLWGGWFGFWLGYLGYGLLTWQFWVVYLPIIIFVILEKVHYKKEN